MGLLGRFAISGLSKANKADALPEEILVHKQTGEFLIKSPTGDIISFDMLARLKTHIDTVSMVGTNHAFSGDVFGMDLDGIELPEVVAYDTNLVPTPLELGTGLNKVLISCDVDSLDLSSHDMISPIQPYIEVVIGLSGTGITARDITVKNILGVNNTTPIHFMSSTTGKYESCTATLKSLKIIKHESQTSNTIRNILYSLLVVTQKGG